MSAPLHKCVWVKSGEYQEDICVILTYECLPDFCFACGKIGHVLRDCDDVTVDKTNPCFGNWLKASTHVGPKRSRGVASPSVDYQPKKKNEDDEDNVIKNHSSAPEKSSQSPIFLHGNGEEA